MVVLGSGVVVAEGRYSQGKICRTLPLSSNRRTLKDIRTEPEILSQVQQADVAGAMEVRNRG